MRQVKAFEAFARTVPDSATQDIALVYDPFTPEPFAGADRYAGDEKIRLSLTSASRDEAEAMLANGQADLGICRARNRSVGNEMEWRALGRSKWILRRNGAFAEVASPVSLLDLSGSTGDYACRVRRAGCPSPANFRAHAFTNELEMLRGLLEQGCGWGFCRPIFTQRSGKKGCPPKWAAGISQTMVTIWKPGSDKRGLINDTLSQLPALWKRSEL